MTYVFDFVGSHSTGKTTLMNRFKEYLDKKGVSNVLVPSVSRTHSEQLNLYHNTGKFEQAWISLMNWANILDSVLRYDVVLCTDLGVRSAAYAIASDKSDEDLVDAHKKMISYFKSPLFTSSIRVCWVYLPIEFPLVSDGLRDKNEDYRLKVDGILKSLITSYQLPYITVRGTIEDRFKKLLVTYSVLVDSSKSSSGEPA